MTPVLPQSGPVTLLGTIDREGKSMSLNIGEQKKPSRQSLCTLDCLNFFLADVRTGVGPFLVTYLLAVHHWNPAHIGVVMAMMGIADLLADTPCGALVDFVKEKRLLIVVAAFLMGVSSVFMTIFPNFYCISAGQIVNGIVSALFAPAVAAITLGIVGRQMFAIRIGRNEVFNHAGNVATALLAGIVGYLFGQEWIFYLVAIIGGASAVSVLFIKNDDIDYLRSEGAP